MYLSIWKILRKNLSIYRDRDMAKSYGEKSRKTLQWNEKTRQAHMEPERWKVTIAARQFHFAFQGLHAKHQWTNCISRWKVSLLLVPYAFHGLEPLSRQKNPDMKNSSPTFLPISQVKKNRVTKRKKITKRWRNGATLATIYRVLGSKGRCEEYERVSRIFLESFQISSKNKSNKKWW